MFTNHRILDIFDYICTRNSHCWARITKYDMEIQRYTSVEQLHEIAHQLDVDVNDLLISTK